MTRGVTATKRASFGATIPRERLSTARGRSTMPQVLAMRGLPVLALGLLTTLGGARAADTAPVALIIAQGGLGDQSYNDLAFSGFKKALAETKLDGKPVESKDVVAQAEDMLRRAAD